jgi:predicted TPR repeat methyltransferase
MRGASQLADCCSRLASRDRDLNVVDGPEATFGLAIECHQRGDLVAAREAYLQVIASCPDHADALHLCGMTHYQQNHPKEAEPYLRAAVEIRPGNRDYRSNLGLVLNKMGNSLEAIESFLAALDIDPDFPAGLLNLGNAHLAAPDSRKAEACFRRLLEIDINHVEGNNSLATLLAGQGKSEEAVQLMERALSVKSDYQDALVNLGRLLGKLGRYDAAVRRLRQASELNPDDSVLKRDLGHALQQLGEYDEALVMCAQAAELAPDDAMSYVGIGNVHQASGQWEEAEVCYQRALGLDPENADALNNLGSVFMHRDDMEAALKCFDAALAQMPDFADALYNSGVALFAMSGLVKAEARFLKSIELKPHFAEAYRCLSIIYRATDRHEEAVRILKQWRQNVPGDPAPDHLLAAGKQEFAPARASDDYIRDEFDRFADDFDNTLARLEYCAPQKIMELVNKQLGSKGADLVVLDAGCGTGLGGPFLDPVCRRLVGVDLSSKMVELAGRTNLYDELLVEEIVEFMEANKASFDLIVSADTLVYFGELEDAMAAAAGALKTGGRIGFSLERMASDLDGDFFLNFSGRYCHHRDYVERCLLKAGLEIEIVESAVLRKEMQQPVQGLIFVARRP